MKNLDKADREFWNSFLEYMKSILNGILEESIAKFGIIPSNIHLFKEKDKLRDGFYIKAEMKSPMKEFMEKNEITHRELELAIFDALWDDLSRTYSLIV